MASSSRAGVTALRWFLPVIGGIGIASFIDRPGGKSPNAASSYSLPKLEANALPDDPEVIKLAALAGRTSEARSRIAALLESGAADEEIASWLVPVLIADPGWLEKFIATVPEQRRIDLARVTLFQMAGLNPDSVWELIRASPFAATAARSNGTDERYKGLAMVGGAIGSSLAAEVLFEPANGFSAAEIADYFKWGTASISNSRRILDEWIAGRWEGIAPQCVRSAWLSLGLEDKAALGDLEKSLPPSLRSVADGYEVLRKINQLEGAIETDPAPEEFKLLGPADVESLVEDRAMSAKPLPLELLAEATPENRKDALGNYFDWIYPFNVDFAHQAIAGLKKVDLTDEEKDGLYKSASYEEWNGQGNLGRALEFASMISDEKERNDSESEILEEFARTDPQDALQHARSMPDGELRTRIETIATESLP